MASMLFLKQYEWLTGASARKAAKTSLTARTCVSDGGVESVSEPRLTPSELFVTENFE